MKIKRTQNKVEFYPDGRSDQEYLDIMVQYSNVRDALYIRISILDKRLSDAQTKMHEATTELSKIKKLWIYKVWRFLKDGKPRGK